MASIVPREILELPEIADTITLDFLDAFRHLYNCNPTHCDYSLNFSVYRRTIIVASPRQLAIHEIESLTHIFADCAACLGFGYHATTNFTLSADRNTRHLYVTLTGCSHSTSCEVSEARRLHRI